MSKKKAQALYSLFTGETDEWGTPVNKKVGLGTIAKKVGEYCTAGLCSGIGAGSGKKGTMCVEAVVSFLTRGDALSDTPLCVNESLRKFKISLNDSDLWRSKKRRGLGLRRIAIAQLGTFSDDYEFEFYDFKTRLGDRLVSVAAKYGVGLVDLANFEAEFGTENVSDSDEVIESLIMSMPKVKGPVARERVYMEIIEHCVQVLKAMKTPGSAYLKYAPVPQGIKL